MVAAAVLPPTKQMMICSALECESSTESRTDWAAACFRVFRSMSPEALGRKVLQKLRRFVHIYMKS